jgi:enoyl-CoA hydratase/carnithine racemase
VKAYPDPVDGLVVDVAAPLVRLRLDRPARRNAVTDDVVLALIQAVEAAGSDESARAVLVQATGAHLGGGC